MNEPNKKYLSLAKFIAYYYEGKKYYYYIKLVLKMKSKNTSSIFPSSFCQDSFNILDNGNKSPPRMKYKIMWDSFDVINIDNLIRIAQSMKAINNKKFSDFLEKINQLIEEINIYNKILKDRLQEYERRKKFENNLNILEKKFKSFNINNFDDIHREKESQFKIIEQEKEKKIRETNEKYKNIMEKLDSIQDKNEFYEFLKNLKLN